MKINEEQNQELSHQKSGHEEIVHEHTIYAEPIFHFNNFSITNSMLNSWLVVFVIVVFSLVFKNKIKKIPSGIQNFLEMIFEMFFNLFDGVTRDRKKTLKFAPLVLCFFFFILLNNWLGVFPGIGSVGQVIERGQELIFVPYFRGGTADLNTTLSLAIIGVVASHIFGAMAIGVWNHLNKFINFKAFLEIFKQVKKDPLILLISPIKIFIGIIEIVSELAKIASLSLRLFGNVFAGEVLLASISALLAFGVPLPFMFLEIGVGLIQALIFSVLIMAYLSMNTVAEEH